MKRIIIILMCLVLMGSLIGCEYEASSHEQSIKANEEAVKNIIVNDSLPKITRSLERENVKRRIEFINQPDKIGYLYLISDNGQLIKEVQVLGKVSSLNSYLTPMEDVHKWNGAMITTEAADLDGTYGENSDGIFWFTADGVYQEWSGMYFYSSERMTFTTQPLLVEEVK
jgi:hypothetical protein